MDLFIILLALGINFGPICIAFKMQENKEKAELERGRRFIRECCERIKKNEN